MNRYSNRKGTITMYMKKLGSEAPQGSRFGRTALFATLVLLALTGCDTGSLLDVDDPDIIDPGEAAGPTGRTALFVGAVGDFSRAYSGVSGDEGGAIMASGLMTDEWAASGTFPSRQEVDQRRASDQGFELVELYEGLQVARASAVRVLEVIQAAEGEEPASRAPLMLSYVGYSLVMLAEEFCSGVPLSEAILETGELRFGEQRTTAELYDLALERFNSAIQAADAAEEIELANLARVGKARTLLNMGDFGGAAAAAASVPTDFVYLVERSANSFGQQNGVYVMNTQDERWTMSNQEGDFVPPFLPEDGAEPDDSNMNDEGLPFLGARDPRVPWERTPEGDLGFDGETPQYNFLGYPAFGIVLDRGANVPLASGIEARLIEAEAALQAGDNGGFIQILNDLRANVELSGPHALRHRPPAAGGSGDRSGPRGSAILRARLLALRHRAPTGGSAAPDPAVRACDRHRVPERRIL